LPHAESGLDVQMLGTRGLPNRYGGSETCVEEVGRRLVETGHHVRVFTRPRTTRSNASGYRGMELVAVPSIPLQVLETLTHSASAMLWLTLRRRRTKRTVLHFHGSGNGGVLPLAKLLRLPTVVTVDGADWERAKWGPIARRLLRIAAGWTARLADVVVADSEQAAGLYRRLWSRTPMYIPYGAPQVQADIDPDQEPLKASGLSPGGYILFVGRFVPEKEIHTLVEAHRQLSKPRPTLVLVGGTQEESAYARDLSRRSSSDVVFAGKLYEQELDPLLRNALLYAQPSAVEGTSPMLLTAMAYALPVIASDIPENRETVGRGGRFFATANSEDLRRALEAVIALDEEARTLVGAKLAKRVRETYSWDAVAESYERAYFTALAACEQARRRPPRRRGRPA
jgi:glycosyltransferase involved in cell wall biosynthesis